VITVSKSALAAFPPITSYQFSTGLYTASSQVFKPRTTQSLSRTTLFGAVVDRWGSPWFRSDSRISTGRILPTIVSQLRVCVGNSSVHRRVPFQPTIALSRHESPSPTIPCAAFRGCGSRFSGSLSGIEPLFPITRQNHGRPLSYHRKLIGQIFE